MIRKWLLKVGLLVVGTTTLFGCGKKDSNTLSNNNTESTVASTTEATTESTTEASTSTETTETTEAATEATTTNATTEQETTTEAAASTETTKATEATTEETLPPKVTSKKTGTGIFNGQIDSNSVEIEMENGEPETFFIYKEKVAEAFNNMDIGAKISFTYGPAKGQVNPQILSVKEQ